MRCTAAIETEGRNSRSEANGLPKLRRNPIAKAIARRGRKAVRVRESVYEAVPYYAILAYLRIKKRLTR